MRLSHSSSTPQSHLPAAAAEPPCAWATRRRTASMPPFSSSGPPCAWNCSMIGFTIAPIGLSTGPVFRVSATNGEVAAVSSSADVGRLAQGARRPRDSTHPGQQAGQRCVPELHIPSGTWSIRWRSGCSCCRASDIPLAQTCWHEPVLARLTSARGFTKTAHRPPLEWKSTRASTHRETHTDARAHLKKFQEVVEALCRFAK